MEGVGPRGSVLPGLGSVLKGGSGSQQGGEGNKELHCDVPLIFLSLQLAGDADVRPCASPPAVIAQQEDVVAPFHRIQP